MVSAKDVIRIYKHLSANGIQIWLTGGWGIDALLGKQTRPHKDLDVIMRLDDVIRMRELLDSDGYKMKEFWPENRWAKDSHENKVATAFVLQDTKGREIDVHAMTIDHQGNGIPAWEEATDFMFKKQDLTGVGMVAGFTVQCITPESQMFCHTGYELSDKQLNDLDLLHGKFDVEYPSGYTHRSI